jgi:outer membrane biosynthesis protein TonB
MDGTQRLSREDRLGLGIAVAAHVALAGLFVLNDDTPASFDIPERMTVSLANEVSLESTAPDPSAEPAASIAPEIAEEPAPPVPEPLERAIPEEVEPAPPPPPRPRATQSPRPRPTATPTPRATQTPRATPTPAPSPARQRAGGSRIGADFLEGRSDSDGNRGSPAATFGPTEQAALSSAITRQLKPHWSAPSGVDADQLVTVLTWELNEDGSLKGNPRVVSQAGITDSNRPQAQLHAERAIRAVQLAAPFNLPDQFYDRWRRIREWRFDRRL